MSECLSINRSSKLYQKFLEKKGKKEVQSSSPSCESNQNKKRMSQSTNQSEKPKASMNNSANDDPIKEIYDQNMETLHFPCGQAEISKQANLDELLKKELSKKRSSTFVDAKQVEPFQLYPHKKLAVKQREIQLQLENKYLSVQNQKLKQKLAEETEKCQIIQLDLDQQRKRSRQLELQLLRAIKQSKPQENVPTQQAQINSEEIDKLREQNHLAKDYLYKLTFKLYQSQQQNQRLQKQIDQMKESLSRRTVQASTQQHPMKNLRQREFQNHQQESKHSCLNEQALAPSLSSARSTSRENRILQIKGQLQQLNLLKVFNGKNRRKKIELERELEQLSFS